MGANKNRSGVCITNLLPESHHPLMEISERFAHRWCFMQPEFLLLKQMRIHFHHITPKFSFHDAHIALKQVLVEAHPLNRMQLKKEIQRLSASNCR